MFEKKRVKCCERLKGCAIGNRWVGRGDGGRPGAGPCLRVARSPCNGCNFRDARLPVTLWLLPSVKSLKSVIPEAGDRRSEVGSSTFPVGPIWPQLFCGDYYPDLTVGAIAYRRFAPRAEPERPNRVVLIEEFVKANSAPDTRDSDPMSARTDLRLKVRLAVS